LGNEWVNGLSAFARRRAQGPSHDHGASAAEIVDNHRDHLHPSHRVVEALDPWFALGDVERLPYLYRWELGPDVRPLEADAIASAEIAATGARVIARRR
jgi:hypothetical protein